MKIIAIAGKQGSGKSYLAQELKKEIEKDGTYVLVLKFANNVYALKTIVNNFFALKGVTTSQDAKNGAMLQWLGQGAREVISENIWIDLLDKTLQVTDVDVVIIDDLRYKNEHLYLRKNSAFIVRLECERNKRKLRTHSWREDEDHVSETDLDDCADFDLMLSTDSLSISECVKEILNC